MPQVADNTRRLSRSSFRRRANIIVLAISLIGGLTVAGYAIVSDPEALTSERLIRMSQVQLTHERERTMRLMLAGALIFAAGPVLVILGAMSVGARNRLQRQSARIPAIPHPTLPLHIPQVSLKIADAPISAAEPRRAPAPGTRTTLARAS